MKKCTKCLLDKPLRDFNKTTKNKDGLHYYCRECQKQIYRENIDRHRENTAKWRKNIRKWYLSLKINKPCEICGHIGHPRAMHWHHIDKSTKEFDISNFFRSNNRARIEQELAKCQLLCADCHAEIEWPLASLLE